MFLTLRAKESSFLRLNKTKLTEFICLIKILASNSNLEIVGFRLAGQNIEAYFFAEDHCANKFIKIINSHISIYIKRFLKFKFNENLEDIFSIDEVSEDNPHLLEAIRQQLHFKKSKECHKYEEFCRACLAVG